MIERFTVKMLRGSAEQLKFKCIVEPKFGHVGYIENNTGERFFFKLSALDINPLGASKIATDKDYTQFLLEKFGYPVISTETFFSDEWCRINNTQNNLTAALEYAEKVGYPRIVKPNSKGQGRGVAKVYSDEELKLALINIFAIDNIALIQPCVPGTDYRVVVYKDKVVAAYSRTPLIIFGDGIKSIRELLPAYDIPLPTIVSRIKREYNLTLDSIPKNGERLQLLDNANLSTGGQARDMTDTICDNAKELAIKAVKDLGLNLAGVDILTTDDIEKSMVEYVIVEVNSMPGMEHYSALGPDQLERTRRLYIDIVQDYFSHD
ncbi:MAG: hypothetical protein WC764_03905 [Candidatus Paceibacterota bacterium]|jgi:D-alanine-D-alanine ligase-like ATP-grasp enzyme